MNLFARRHVAGPFGDATSGYEIDLHKEEITVGEFIDAVLIQEPKEWGDVRIQFKDSALWDMPKVEYKNGSILEEGMTITDEHKSLKIKSATSNGGWSNMDYTLKVFE